MKKLIILCLVALSAFTASAQQKIGHVNSLTILQAMPEFKQMNDAIDKKKGEYEKALESMYMEYDRKQKELNELTKQQGVSDVILESKITELQDLQKRVGDFETKVNDDLGKLQQDLIKPINDKYLKAVKEVATANAYSYVIDIVSGAVAYFPEGGSDVTNLVLAKLGITLPAEKK